MTQRATEARHPDSYGLQDVTSEEVLSRLLAAQDAAIDALRPAFPQLVAVAEAGTSALRDGYRMAYVGAGSSGLMGLADCLELAGTFGIAPERTPMLLAGGTQALLHMTGVVEDDPNFANADVAGLAPRPGDLLLCLSASGSTPYTLAVAQAAQAKGARVAGFANVVGSPLLDMADFPVLLDTGPEIVAGSTRMAAGTAQKIALNMVSVLVGIGLGHVHEGYMVNVTADNGKLIDRAARIVASLAGVEQAEATVALKLADGSVKVAVLVATGATPDAARRSLASHRDHLGPAIDDLRIHKKLNGQSPPTGRRQ